MVILGRRVGHIFILEAPKLALFCWLGSTGTLGHHKTCQTCPDQAAHRSVSLQKHILVRSSMQRRQFATGSWFAGFQTT